MTFDTLATADTHPAGDALPARQPRASRTPKGEATRERIIDAAEDLIAGKGYASTTLRQIAALAGVELGLVTYHAGSKDNLFDLVVGRRARAVCADLDEALDSVDRSRHGIEAVSAILAAFCNTSFDRLAQGDRSWTNHVRLLLHRTSAGIDAQTDQEVLDHFLPVRERYVRAVIAAMPDRNPIDVLWAFEIFQSAYGAMLFGFGRMERGYKLDAARIAELRHRLLPFCAAGFENLPKRPQRFSIPYPECSP